MKPNIFKLATSELSQDAFFTWFLQWADSKYIQQNEELNKTSRDFIRLLLCESEDYTINKVKAGRQWHNMDIWVEVNDEYFIGIEDKTTTCEHSEQLKRYKEIATNHYKDKTHKLVFVYLKTGNESLSTLNEIKRKGYSVIDRRSVLQVLNARSIENDIFNDFKKYLTEIENETNSFDTLGNITSLWKAGEGFFMKLQQNIGEWSDWRYVSNARGGFLGMWYHWRTIHEVGSIYIQIENNFESGINLVIKIGDWEPNTDTLYRVSNDLKSIAKANGLTITKPYRFRTGATSTLAIVKDAFQSDENGNFDFKGFLETLKQLEKTLYEYSNDKKPITKNQLTENEISNTSLE